MGQKLGPKTEDHCTECSVGICRVTGGGWSGVPRRRFNELTCQVCGSTFRSDERDRTLVLLASGPRVPPNA